jgi:uncharacterized protein YfaS (alpha-2-macroglobulin family)
LLFWSPFLQSDQSGKARFDFFTSDLEGKYKIVIQGLSTDGKAGYSETLLEVKD